MRIGDWLDAVDRAEPAAWSILLDSTLRLAREGGAREPEDLASSFVLVQIERGARDARRANRAVPFERWLGGCVRRQIRAETRTLSGWANLNDPNSLVADGHEGVPSESAASRRAELRRRMACRLSRAEVVAVELHLEGLGQRAAADRLGITRDSFRDRLERAIAKLTAKADPLAWVAPARPAQRSRRPAIRRIVERYVGGMRIGEIAAATGLSYASVQSRITRARRRARVQPSFRRSVAPVAVPAAAAAADAA